MLRRLFKVTCLLFLILIILIEPVYAGTTISNQIFSLSLPDEWMEIPQKVMLLEHNEIQKQFPKIKIPVYDYGLQLRARNWFDYPYMLIQVNNLGRIPEHELKSLTRSKMMEGFQKASSDTSPLISNVELNKMSYDETSHIFWMTAQGDVISIGKILSLVVMIPTEKGSLWLYSYATESSFNEYLPVFRQILASTGVSPEFVYKLQWTDNIPILAGINWGDVGIAALIGGLLELVFGCFSRNKR